MQGYNLEIRHIPGKRNPADTLSRQDKKDALGRKTAVNDANADLVNELRIPSDADDEALQEALKKLFNAQSIRVRSKPSLVTSPRSVQRCISIKKFKSSRSVYNISKPKQYFN